MVQYRRMAITDHPETDSRKSASKSVSKSASHRAVDVHRPGRGGDRGGRKPTVREYFMFGVNHELDWIRKSKSRGRRSIAACIRLILGAAAALELGWEAWQAIAKNPAPYRDAINEVAQTEQEDSP